MRQRKAVIIVLIVSGLATGCKQAPKPKDIGELSQTYADLLMAQQRSRTDTTAVRKSIDSTLKAHGFDDEEEFRERLKDVGQDPEVMRKIFDSTQQLLQKITNEALPPPPPPAAK
jgi:hypothetical protein